MARRINTSSAPAAIGPYSQAIAHEGIIFVSGQIPLDPTTGQLVTGDIADQTRQSLTNVRSILEAAGSSMQKVLKVTVLLADINDFAAMNEVYAEFFSEPYPARAAYAVAGLPKGAQVEIEVIAAQ